MRDDYFLDCYSLLLTILLQGFAVSFSCTAIDCTDRVVFACCLQAFWRHLEATESACNLMMFLLAIANASVAVTARVSRGSTAALLLLKEKGMVSANIAAASMTLLAAVWQSTPVSSADVCSVRGNITVENCQSGLESEARKENACENIVAAMNLHHQIPSVLEVCMLQSSTPELLSVRSINCLLSHQSHELHATKPFLEWAAVAACR